MLVSKLVFAKMTLYTLQLLRFIAALLVLFFHLGLVHSGYKGVDVFFVISGFVMYYTLFCRPRPKALKFIVNRFTKIYLLYWIALIALLIIKPFSLNASFFRTFLLFPGHDSVLGVSWSLSFELYFYLLIGSVVYLIADRFHKLIFVTFFLISTFITFANLTSFTLKGSALNFLLGPNFWEFLLGVICAFLLSGPYKSISWAISLSGAILSMVFLFLIFIPYNTPTSYIVYGLISGLVVFFCTAFEKKKPISKKVSQLFKVLGDASYAIYLFGPIITISIGVSDNASKTVIIVLTIAFSILVNQVLENSILNWSRHILLNRMFASNAVLSESSKK